MSQELQNNNSSHSQDFGPRWLLIALCFFIIGGGFFVYRNFIKPQPESSPQPGPPAIIAPEALAERFAAYEEVSVNINPQVPAYTVDLDLSNTINKDDFDLSKKAKEFLVKNAFVVVPTEAQEFFSIYNDRTIYEKNRYHHTPSFITTDSMLHNYHLAFDHLLRILEKEELYQELTNLSHEMLKASQAQYEQLKGTEWENAAKRNVAFFMVPDKILYPTAGIPEYVKEEVEIELDFIEEHIGIAPSPIINMGVDPSEGIWIETPQGPQPLELYKEDYSQYVPRGHYTKSEELKKYFKAMMWYGRMTFRLKNPDETRSAVLATLALKESAERYNSWDKIYEPTVFFVGKSDDISFYDYYDILKEVYGTDQLTLSLVANDKVKFDSFLEKTKDLSPPQINSIPIFEASIQSDREEEIKGFRLMGQRFTIDASIFQRLMYREVGDKTTSCANYDPQKTGCLSEARCLPKGLDIPAAMGSNEALSLLKSQSEFDYACYPENMTKMKEYIASLDKTIWTQNLYWGWLYSLLTLGKEKPDGYPTFMKNLAWIRKELNTYLGSWTELKRDTILYSKQPMAELGGGGDWAEEEVDDRGYVEPNPYVYARLASLLKMTKEGLQIRNLLSDENKEFLERLEKLALSLKTISEKELNGILPTDEEFDLIRTYGGSLEHIWLDAYKDRGIVSARQQLDDEPAPVVADVATDPNGTCLEEATGNIFEIYVVVPVEGILRIAKGGVYSHYEFKQPMENRLTDEAWREILKKGEEPDLAEWTNIFIAQ